MIYAWDNYPVHQFPGLWKWMATQIEEKRLVMPTVAFGEVARKIPDCGKWLIDNNLERLPITDAILQNAIHIKGSLRIVGDKYHSKGVGENDIFIVATAHAHGAELVSDEGRQSAQPKELYRRRIPAVCNMTGVSVSCINFIEYIKHSNVVFR